MEKALKYRLLVCLVTTLLGLWLLSPTIYKIYHPDVEELPRGMPNTPMTLGLDLQGGVHMVLGVDLEKYNLDQLQIYKGDLQSVLSEREGIKDVKVNFDPQRKEIEVVTQNPADADKASRYIGQNFTSLRFVGEHQNTLVLDLDPTQAQALQNNAIDQTIETIRNRIDEYGVAEPIISKKGSSQVLVQFPGAKDPERLKDLIGQTAQLYFQIVHECQDAACLAAQTADLEGKINDAERAGNYTRESFDRFSEYRAKINADLKGQIPENTIVAFERIVDTNVVDNIQLRPMLLMENQRISGEKIENAYPSLQSDNFGPQYPVVAFQMSPSGAPLLGEMTGTYRKYFMAILLDDVIKSAPQINSAISDSGIITLGQSNFEELNKEAQDLALVLRAGALPAKIEIQEERVIGPSIGRDAIQAGKMALILTVVFVFFFMWIYYGKAGLVANFVTLINVSLIFAILGSLGATLTLPGIAGIVLTVGMAVDALIIIFERMREELRAGRTMNQVVEQGFDNAFSTILDSNITTVIGAYVLSYFGTGSIRGFAFTLMVGIVVNVFMATFFTRTLFRAFYGRGKGNLSAGLSRRELQEIHAK